MPLPQQIRPFTSLLVDVSALNVVSRLERNRAPSPEEIAEEARLRGFKAGHEDGYAAGSAEGHNEGLMRGHEEAYSRAYKEATEKFGRELGELMSILSSHVAEVNAEIPQWFADAESAMTERTMTILQRLMSAELELGRDHALEIVKECLAEVTHSKRVKVRMNPFDTIVASQYRDQLLAISPQLSDIEFVDDPSIEGGCVVESEGGMIDARLDTRLAMIEGELAA